MSFTEQARNDMLNSRFTASDIYVALFTSAGEVAVAGYTRQKATFSAPDKGQVVNTNAIFFPIVNTTWGTITEVGLFDAVTGGKLLAKMTPEYIKTMDPGSQYHIPSGMALARLI